MLMIINQRVPGSPGMRLATGLFPRLAVTPCSRRNRRELGAPSPSQIGRRAFETQHPRSCRLRVMRACDLSSLTYGPEPD